MQINRGARVCRGTKSKENSFAAFAAETSSGDKVHCCTAVSDLGVVDEVQPSNNFYIFPFKKM